MRPGTRFQDSLAADRGFPEETPGVADAATVGEGPGRGGTREQRPLRSGVVRRADRVEDPAALVGLVEQGMRVERLLAEGGMGVVYAVRRLGTGERAALKVLRCEHAGDAGVRSRFAREVSFARRVDHPGVCPVLGDGHLSDGRPFYLMPLYEGPTLGQEVRRAGPLPFDRALAIADQILGGLAALHAARIVHRDLQPDNVLLAPGEGGEQIKLLDLGFAQEPGADTGDGVTPGSPGLLVGTLPFMSPEQAMRGRAITARSDLFAVALLIRYALSGKSPFRGEGDVDLLVALVRSTPIPLRRERRDVPRALDDVLARALAKHPDGRFASAVEMRAALRDVAASGRARRAQPGRARPLR